jgi:hypothetical protein
MAVSRSTAPIVCLTLFFALAALQQAHVHHGLKVWIQAELFTTWCDCCVAGFKTRASE